MIWNIETLAIDILNIAVKLHLDPSKKYKKILIHFERDVPDYNKIIEEINKRIIVGQSIPNNYESIDQPVFMFTSLKEKKTEISYPNYYKFSFRIYEL